MWKETERWKLTWEARQLCQQGLGISKVAEFIAGTDSVFQGYCICATRKIKTLGLNDTQKHFG